MIIGLPTSTGKRCICRVLPVDEEIYLLLEPSSRVGKVDQRQAVIGLPNPCCVAAIHHWLRARIGGMCSHIFADLLDNQGSLQLASLRGPLLRSTNVLFAGVQTDDWAARRRIPVNVHRVAIGDHVRSDSNARAIAVGANRNDLRLFVRSPE